MKITDSLRLDGEGWCGELLKLMNDKHHITTFKSDKAQETVMNAEDTLIAI